MTNRLKAIIAEKGYVLNAYCAIPSAFVAEIVARAGFDAVTLDMQHGLIGYDAAQPLFTALTAAGVIPMVRTPALDPALIMKLLDAGVLGITCASVQTADEAAGLVQACRYPPLGNRSMGPVRAGLIYPDYQEQAGELVTAFAMIETALGVSEIDSILATPGLDGIYIGPFDLAMSMNLPPSADGRFAPEVERAIDLVLGRCRDAGLICGMLAPDGVKAFELVRRGFQFVTISSDMRALQGAMGGWIADFLRVQRAS